MVHKDYCSKCKSKDIPLIKYSVCNGVQYYYCRECQSNRMNKYYAGAGKKAVKDNALNMLQKYPEKARARRSVYRAVKEGRLDKPPTCQGCNMGGRIEGHHMNYSKPLEVVWLCTGCHANYHEVK